MWSIGLLFEFRSRNRWYLRFAVIFDCLSFFNRFTAIMAASSFRGFFLDYIPVQCIPQAPEHKWQLKTHSSFPRLSLPLAFSNFSRFDISRSLSYFIKLKQSSSMCWPSVSHSSRSYVDSTLTFPLRLAESRKQRRSNSRITALPASKTIEDNCLLWRASLALTCARLDFSEFKQNLL